MGDETLHAVAEQVATRSPNEDVVLLDEFIEAFPVASRPMTQSPLSFVCGSMYDRNDLRAALERATLVFAFATKFNRLRRNVAGPERIRRRERRARSTRTMMSRPISTITTTTARIYVVPAHTAALARGRAGGRRQRIASAARRPGSPLVATRLGPDAERNGSVRRPRVPRRSLGKETRGDENSEKKTQKKKKKRVVS